MTRRALAGALGALASLACDHAVSVDLESSMPRAAPAPLSSSPFSYKLGAPIEVKSLDVYAGTTVDPLVVGPLVSGRYIGKTEAQGDGTYRFVEGILTIRGGVTFVPPRKKAAQ